MIRNGIASVIGLIATLVRVVFSIIGALIVIHAAFVLFSANPHNVLVEFTAGIRDSFGWFTKNLFTPKDHKIGQAINDALAGLIWVVVGNFASKLILRFAPAKKSRDKDKDKGKSSTPRATPVRESKPKQEAPVQQQAPAAAQQQAPVQQQAPAPVQQEAPAAPSPAAAAVLQKPEPEPEREAEPEAAAEVEAEATSQPKHQARATARREDRTEAADKAQAGDRAQA